MRLTTSTTCGWWAAICRSNRWGRHAAHINNMRLVGGYLQIKQVRAACGSQHQQHAAGGRLSADQTGEGGVRLTTSTTCGWWAAICRSNRWGRHAAHNINNMRLVGGYLQIKQVRAACGSQHQQHAAGGRLSADKTGEGGVRLTSHNINNMRLVGGYLQIKQVRAACGSQHQQHAAGGRLSADQTGEGGVRLTTSTTCGWWAAICRSNRWGRHAAHITQHQQHAAGGRLSADQTGEGGVRLTTSTTCGWWAAICRSNRWGRRAAHNINNMRLVGGYLQIKQVRAACGSQHQQHAAGGRLSADQTGEGGMRLTSHNINNMRLVGGYLQIKQVRAACGSRHTTSTTCGWWAAICRSNRWGRHAAHVTQHQQHAAGGRLSADQTGEGGMQLTSHNINNMRLVGGYLQIKQVRAACGSRHTTSTTCGWWAAICRSNRWGRRAAHNINNMRLVAGYLQIKQVRAACGSQHQQHAAGGRLSADQTGEGGMRLTSHNINNMRLSGGYLQIKQVRAACGSRHTTSTTCGWWAAICRSNRWGRRAAHNINNMRLVAGYLQIKQVRAACGSQHQQHAAGGRLSADQTGEGGVRLTTSTTCGWWAAICRSNRWGRRAAHNINNMRLVAGYLQIKQVRAACGSQHQQHAAGGRLSADQTGEGGVRLMSHNINNMRLVGGYLQIKQVRAACGSRHTTSTTCGWWAAICRSNRWGRRAAHVTQHQQHAAGGRLSADQTGEGGVRLTSHNINNMLLVAGYLQIKQVRAACGSRHTTSITCGWWAAICRSNRWGRRAAHITQHQQHAAGGRLSADQTGEGGVRLTTSTTCGWWAAICRSNRWGRRAAHNINNMRLVGGYLQIKQVRAACGSHHTTSTTCGWWLAICRSNRWGRRAAHVTQHQQHAAVGRLSADQTGEGGMRLTTSTTCGWWAAICRSNRWGQRAAHNINNMRLVGGYLQIKQVRAACGSQHQQHAAGGRLSADQTGEGGVRLTTSTTCGWWAAICRSNRWGRHAAHVTQHQQHAAGGRLSADQTGEGGMRLTSHNINNMRLVGGYLQIKQVRAACGSQHQQHAAGGRLSADQTGEGGMRLTTSTTCGWWAAICRSNRWGRRAAHYINNMRLVGGYLQIKQVRAACGSQHQQHAAGGRLSADQTGEGGSRHTTSTTCGWWAAICRSNRWGRRAAHNINNMRLVGGYLQIKQVRAACGSRHTTSTTCGWWAAICRSNRWGRRAAHVTQHQQHAAGGRLSADQTGEGGVRLTTSTTCGWWAAICRSNRWGRHAAHNINNMRLVGGYLQIKQVRAACGSQHQQHAAGMRLSADQTGEGGMRLTTSTTCGWWAAICRSNRWGRHAAHVTQHAAGGRLSADQTGEGGMRLTSHNINNMRLVGGYLQIKQVRAACGSRHTTSTTCGWWAAICRSNRWGRRAAHVSQHQ